ncbi:N-acyl-D-amino-acid deacylase family protein [Pontibacter arcticus]|uniref:N-acyl-D-amino acid deacylase n=1 Tax=Pontibacter arcticus TaxID=2080288 RepID=A0A364REW3_9BACT|nr:amidohydrolase family protein [Pontibacter arcticus]RAU82888.1 N-acyl-D-amino acid deacylase [Pontibacter arcticus]
MTYDLHIQNALIIDGTGAAPFQADIWVAANTITIDKGEIPKEQATAHRTIDATGLVVTPGFIDAHAHGEPLKNPEFKNFLAMGVTTICLGQDGFAPDLGEDSYQSGQPLQEWMTQVEAIRPDVNIAMFAGHNTIRMLSGTRYEPIPTEENLLEMERLLKLDMENGCFGMTTGLEYNPGLHTHSAELERLAKTVGAANGLIMSHMRSEDDATIQPAIAELLTQGKHCPVQISHIKVVYGKGKARGEEIRKQLNDARAKGIQVTADFYPYSASYTSIEILFPEWAKKPNNYEEVKQTRRDELLTFLKNKIEHRNGPDATMIGTGPYKSKTLKQLSEELNKPFEEVLLEDIGPYGAFGAYFIMDDDLQETLLLDPHTMLCTDGSPAMNHPRSFGSFAKMIETYVLKKQLLPLEEGIRKMTGLPADTIGITDRGKIQDGFKADLLIFDPAEIKENATFENAQQLATGFMYVIVNGQIVKEGEQFSKERAGTMLRKPKAL